MSNQKIYTSAELMSHYMQAEILSPDKKFEALQSQDGHSLLFSIGTDQKFYLTEEVTDHGTGWNRKDLTANLASHFPSGTILTAKTFAVDQNDTTSQLSIVLAVTAGDTDYLFVADLSENEEDHLTVLVWQPMPFDSNNHPAQELNISDVYVLQTASVPLIVVDTVPTGTTTLERYYIDSTKFFYNQYWNLYTLPVNMDAASARVCGGRSATELVDGIYSLGKVGDNPAVFYQPLYNSFAPTAATAASQLVIIGEKEECPAAFASTVSAATKKEGFVYTDLYVSTNLGSVYLFTADNQKNNAKGQKLVSHELFKSVSSLYAYTVAGRVVVWGLNRSQEVFYIECPANQVCDPAAWSYPVPIASSVEQIAPYKNKVNGGNTFFAHTGTNTLKKAMQDPVSTSWITQDILLAAEAQVNAQKCDCYITRITVCDERNAPLANTPVSLSSAYRVPVYINNRYYVLDTQTIHINTDALGAIKIVQRVENLQGARIFIHQSDGTVQLINPMDKAAAKAATLNTSDKLAQAQVTNDRGESQKPLVSPQTDEDVLASAASSIQTLTDAYAHYNQTMPAFKKQAPRVSGDFRFSPTARIHTLALNRTTMQLSVVGNVGDAMSDLADAVVVAAGDLCNWLRDATEYVIQIIEDTAQSVWAFVATIGEKVYTFVIDTVEKVIAALEAIFEALATLIKDIIQFLKFLFDWEDIARTNAVFVNLIHLYMDYGVSKIAGLKDFINEEIAVMIQGINDWAGLQGPNATFADQPMDYSRTQTDYTEVYTTPNTYVQDLYTQNVANAYYTDYSSSTATVPVDTVEQLLHSLLDALKAHGESVKLACDAMYKQLFENDKYKSMSIKEILVTLIAIIADSVLASVAEILDLVIDLIVDLLDAVIQELTRPIWIPVLSDFLSLVFGYTVKHSHLDMICLVGAFPGTIIYKTITLEAPFTEDDGFSTKIIEAQNYNDLEESFNAPPLDYSEGFDSMIPLPQPAKDILFMTGHIISGFAAGLKAVLIVAEDLAELPDVPGLTKAKEISGFIQSVSSGAAGMVAKPYPIQNSAISLLSTSVFFISISSQVIFMVVPKVGSLITKSVIAEIGAMVDLLASMTAIAPVAYHFVELAEAPSNDFRTLAIIDETARLCGFLSNIAADIAKLDPEPFTSTVVAVTSSVLNVLNGGLQIAESILDDVD